VVSGNRFELVDSHCHLNFPEFDEDRDKVIDKARRNGILKIVIPGIDIETSRSAIEYSHRYDDVFCAVGVHPNSGKSWTERSRSELRELAADEKVLAIGEIGLDYYRDYCPKETQREILSTQLVLASELNLPVIIHLRESAEDLIEILEKWHDQLVKIDSKLVGRPGVLHSYSSNLEIAQRMTDRYFKLGIGGPVTFHNAKDLQAIVTQLSLASLLVETDAPYLSPHPFRGERNEPTNVRIVAEKIAELKAVPVEMVAKATSHSAGMLFNWGGSH
jgi:TatD DNase family protein